MSSLTDLREVVDVVIGVDTHVYTHAAAVIDARTGGVLAELTVHATADGYEQLVEFADEHAILRTFNLVFREVCGPGYVDRTVDAPVLPPNFRVIELST